jgi:hypothetical protein
MSLRAAHQPCIISECLCMAKCVCPCRMELSVDTLMGMDTDPGPDATGHPSGQAANPAPDIPSTLGMSWPQGRAWATVWTLAPLPGWVAVRHPDMPERLRLHVKVAPTETGFAVVAVQVEREDGRAITAQDLRRVKLPPAWVLASSLGPRVTSPRPGPRGKGDDHWRTVYELWLRAQQVAPHTPVRWMLAEWEPEVSDATMRRWVARARERAAVNGWQEEDHDE